MPSSVDAVKFKLLICFDISHLKMLLEAITSSEVGGIFMCMRGISFPYEAK